MLLHLRSESQFKETVVFCKAALLCPPEQLVDIADAVQCEECKQGRREVYQS